VGQPKPDDVYNRALITGMAVIGDTIVFVAVMATTSCYGNAPPILTSQAGRPRRRTPLRPNVERQTFAIVSSATLALPAGGSGGGGGWRSAVGLGARLV
jgi:hypothetical protein